MRMNAPSRKRSSVDFSLLGWLELAEVFIRNGQIQSAERLYKEYMTNALLDGHVADFENALTLLP
jgi:hypothetical protein